MKSLASLEAESTSALDPRIQILSQTMGFRFTAFAPSHARALLADPVEALLVADVVDAWIASPSLIPRHAVVPISSRQCVVLVSFRRPGGVLAAFATVDTPDYRLVEQLAHTSLRLLSAESELDQRRNELQSCMEQLSYDLEEQSWLRGLSQHMQLTDVRLGVNVVAKEILPSLRQLVAAESAMVLLDRRGSASRESRSDLSITCDGSLVLPEHVLPSWLKKLDFSVQGNLRVANGPAVEPEIAAHGIRSYAAARLGVARNRTGWLVAFNKTETNFASWRGSAVLPHGLCSREFGSVEAGLLESAAVMLSMHEHNVSLLRGQEELTVGVIRSMSSAIDARDPYTRGHSERVGRFARRIAGVMGIDAKEQNRIYLSGLLHDVGKIGIPDYVLLKPGKLTEEEFQIIRQHPEIGARIVESLPQLRDLLPGILHHHESIDGSGYPHGLKGAEIPMQARIMAVADTYDAMTSHRPYRPGMPHAKSIEIITSRAGIQWDVDAVKAFLSLSQQTLEQEASLDNSSDLTLTARSERPSDAATIPIADFVATPLLGVLTS